MFLWPWSLSGGAFEFNHDYVGSSMPHSFTAVLLRGGFLQAVTLSKVIKQFKQNVKNFKTSKQVCAVILCLAPQSQFFANLKDKNAAKHKKNQKYWQLLISAFKLLTF